MARRSSARRAALGIRRCLACGYCGHFAQIGSAAGSRQRAERDGRQRGTSDVLPLASRGSGHCPRCGCDFGERPPRSYAEMEGLDLGDSSRSSTDRQQFEAKMVERWLAFLFVLVIAAAVAIGIAARLFAPVVGPVLPGAS